MPPDGVVVSLSLEPEVPAALVLAPAAVEFIAGSGFMPGVSAVLGGVVVVVVLMEELVPVSVGALFKSGGLPLPLEPEVSASVEAPVPIDLPASV